MCLTGRPHNADDARRVLQRDGFRINVSHRYPPPFGSGKHAVRRAKSLLGNAPRWSSGKVPRLHQQIRGKAAPLGVLPRYEVEIRKVSCTIPVVGQPPVVPYPAVGEIEATAEPWNSRMRRAERLVEFTASTPRIEAIGHPPKCLGPVFRRMNNRLNAASSNARCSGSSKQACQPGTRMNAWRIRSLLRSKHKCPETRRAWVDSRSYRASRSSEK